MQNKCAGIKICTERREGELTKETELNRGGRPKNQLQDATSFDEQNNNTLKELGIEKTQSHRWQTLADMPEEVFEKHIQEKIEKKEELTAPNFIFC